MEPIVRNMSRNAQLKVVAVCNDHGIPNCGVCVELYGTAGIERIAHCGVCPSDSEKPIEERKKLWQKYDGEKTPEMIDKAVSDGLEQKGSTAMRTVCAKCGKCHSKDQMCDHIDMSKKKKMLKKKLKKNEPEIMECNELSVAHLRKNPRFAKIVQYARLRNDRRTLQELQKVVNLLS